MTSMLGARRFGEYRKLVQGISDRMLSQRLKKLESLDLLNRKVIPTTPVQILYEPSQRGRDLMTALRPWSPGVAFTYPTHWRTTATPREES